MKILAAMKMFVCGEITAEEVKEMFNHKSVEDAEPAMLEGGNPMSVEAVEPAIFEGQNPKSVEAAELAMLEGGNPMREEQWLEAVKLQEAALLGEDPPAKQVTMQEERYLEDQSSIHDFNGWDAFSNAEFETFLCSLEKKEFVDRRFFYNTDEVFNKSNMDVELELNVPFYREEIIGKWRISNMEEPYYREKDEVELIVPTKSEVGDRQVMLAIAPKSNGEESNVVNLKIFYSGKKIRFMFVEDDPGGGDRLEEEPDVRDGVPDLVNDNKYDKSGKWRIKYVIVVERMDSNMKFMKVYVIVVERMDSNMKFLKVNVIVVERMDMFPIVVERMDRTCSPLLLEEWISYWKDETNSGWKDETNSGWKDETNMKPILDGKMKPILDGKMKPILDGKMKPILDGKMKPILDGQDGL